MHDQLIFLSDFIKISDFSQSLSVVQIMMHRKKFIKLFPTEKNLKTWSKNLFLRKFWFSPKTWNGTLHVVGLLASRVLIINYHMSLLVIAIEQLSSTQLTTPISINKNRTSNRFQRNFQNLFKTLETSFFRWFFKTPVSCHFKA